MTVEALAAELADAPPGAVERFMATLDGAEAAAVEAALALLRARRVADLAVRFPTMPPAEAAELLARLDGDTVEQLRSEMDVRDLDAFVAGRAQEQVRGEAEVDGPTWMRSFFPSYATAPFAPHMGDFWRWVWSIRRGEYVPAYVGVWFRGGGKALAVDTPIPTPTGWTTMGDLLPGSVVFDHSGAPVEVVGVSAIEERPSSRVTFRGGAIVASDDHLWAVADRPTRHAWQRRIPENWPTWTGTRQRDKGPCLFPGCVGPARTAGLCTAHYEQRRNGRPLTSVRPRGTRGVFDRLATAVLTTSQLASAPMRDGAEYRWTIPTCGSLELPEAWLSIEPYLLGAWLGDGTTTAGQITVGLQDYEATAVLLAETGRRLSTHRYGNVYRVTVGGLHGDLRRLGLMGDKHVPTIYTRASAKQRLALLQGLMDTDGTPAKGGGAFVSTRQVLAHAGAELARSLGLRATVTEGRARLDGRDCGPKWTVHVAAGVPLFRLPRKAAKQEAWPAHTMHGSLHYVSGIEPIGMRLVKCITVDSPGHCFLAGEAMVPTHNSSSAEAAVAGLGARGRRRYALYISGTQHQADGHVSSLGAMLESARFAAAYPEMAKRAVTQYGTAKGWSRTRLHTASGFVVDALGLTVEARGIKIEEDRPDLIVLDDIDSRQDGPAMVKKKIELLTETILPAGSQDVAVLAIQNVVHPNSIFARLCGVADEPADFLSDRIVVGPIPAVRDLDVVPEVAESGETRWVIQGGEPTWAGYPLEAAQAAIDKFGYSAFLREGQHQVQARPGGMYNHVQFRRCKPAEVPFLQRTVCWVDPAVTDNDGSDSQGVQVDGISGPADTGTIYRLWSWEARTTPLKTLCLAVRVAVMFGCPYVGIETDQGGDTWGSVFREACDLVSTPGPDDPTLAQDGGELVDKARLPGMRDDKAGSGHGPKFERSSRMLAEYEGPRAPVHVEGTHQVLEAALWRFGPLGSKPFDLADAAYWSWQDLRRGGRATIKPPGGSVPARVSPAQRAAPVPQGPAGVGQPRATVGLPGRQLGRVTRSR